MSYTIAIRDGDLYFPPSGRLLMINSTTKGEQDFVEEFLTEYIPDEDYGDELFALVGGAGGVAAGDNVGHAMEAISSQKIHDVVQRLQGQQQDDPYSDPDERIGGISRLITQADPNDPTNTLYYVELVTESGNVISDSTGYIVSSKQVAPATTAQIYKMLVATPISPTG